MPEPARDASHRVVVTGMGAVSAAGWGVPALAGALRRGETAIGGITRFDDSRQRTHVAGEVRGEAPASFRRPAQWSRLANADRFALVAAVEAAQQAGLPAGLRDLNAGVFFSSSTGGLIESEWYLSALWAGKRQAKPLTLMAGHHINSPGDCVARHLGVTGPVQTFSSACASAALAIDAALRAVRAGEVDVALCGGADSLCALTYSGFNALRAVDARPCRPFREDRAGMSLGEGGAVLVLETLASARARGATPLAELLGSGASCDANHMTAPHPQGAGAVMALRRSLEDAGIDPAEVGHINAHGTGTPLNDVAESAAFRTVLGERMARVPVSATKSIVGHLLGASGAIEAVATILCLRAGEAHPAAGAGQVDAAASVDLVLGTPRAIDQGAAAISTSLGFGGSNAALVLSACPPA